MTYEQRRTDIAEEMAKAYHSDKQWNSIVGDGAYTLIVNQFLPLADYR